MYLKLGFYVRHRCSFVPDCQIIPNIIYSIRFKVKVSCYRHIVQLSCCNNLSSSISDITLSQVVLQQFLLNIQIWPIGRDRIFTYLKIQSFHITRHSGYMLNLLNLRYFIKQVGDFFQIQILLEFDMNCMHAYWVDPDVADVTYVMAKPAAFL